MGETQGMNSSLWKTSFLLPKYSGRASITQTFPFQRGEIRRNKRITGPKQDDNSVGQVEFQGHRIIICGQIVCPLGLLGWQPCSLGPSGWWSYSLGPTIGSGLCIHGSALKVILLSFTTIGLIFIYHLHTFLPLFSTISIDKSTQQRKSKGNEEKQKELRYKTCGWNLTFVLFIQKCGMEKTFSEVRAEPFYFMYLGAFL